MKKRVFDMDVVFPMEYSLLEKDQGACEQLKGILDDKEKKKNMSKPPSVDILYGPLLPRRRGLSLSQLPCETK